MSDTICLQSSATWVALISLIPNNAVQAMVILLAILITLGRLVNEFRPQSVGLRIEKALHKVEGNICDAVGHRLIISDTGGRTSIEIRLKKQVCSQFYTRYKALIRSYKSHASPSSIQFRASSLREITLRGSLSPWKELTAVVKGHSFHLLMCLWEIRVLEVDLEVNKYFKCLYHCQLLL